MNSNRRELLELFARLSEKYPEVRFGQLVANFASLAESNGCEGIYEIEDEVLATAIRDHLKRSECVEASPAA